MGIPGTRYCCTAELVVVLVLAYQVLVAVIIPGTPATSYDIICDSYY